MPFIFRDGVSSLNTWRVTGVRGSVCAGTPVHSAVAPVSITQSSGLTEISYIMGLVLCSLCVSCAALACIRVSCVYFMQRLGNGFGWKLWVAGS